MEYPRECYKSLFHYLLKVPSPTKIRDWSLKRDAVYFRENGFEVWIVDAKTNGEKLREND